MNPLVSHVSDSEPALAVLMSSGPSDLVLAPATPSTAEGVAPIKPAARTYGKPRELAPVSPAGVDIISLPATTPEAEDCDTTLMPSEAVDQAAPLFLYSSPSKDSDGSDDFDAATLAQMRAKFGFGQGIRDLDAALRDGEDDDEAVKLVLAQAPPSPSHSQTSEPPRRSSREPTSPTSEDEDEEDRPVARRKGRAIVADSDDEASDPDGLPMALPASRVLVGRTSEQIVEDLSSSSAGATGKKIKGKKSLDFGHRRELSNSDEDVPAVRKKGKLKVLSHVPGLDQQLTCVAQGLTKKELEEMNREAAALKRSAYLRVPHRAVSEVVAEQNVRLESKKTHLGMSKFLENINARTGCVRMPCYPLAMLILRSASTPKPLSDRIPSMPAPTTHRSTASTSAAGPSATPLERFADDDQYNAESYDRHYLGTQTMGPPPRKVSHNPDFVDREESDPIESASQVRYKGEILTADDDGELPDAADAVKIVNAEAQRKARLADLKANGLRWAPPKANVLAASSSDDDLEIEHALPTVALSRGHPTKREPVQRTESQLDRAGKAFGVAKREDAVSHGELGNTLLAKSRFENARVRQRKAEEFLAAGGRMRAEAAQPAEGEVAPTPDIHELLKNKRAAAAAPGSDEADEADDGDFDPDAPEGDDDDELGSVSGLGSGDEGDAEAEDDEEEDVEQDDDKGSINGAEAPSIAIRPDSPKKQIDAPPRVPFASFGNDSDEGSGHDKENAPVFSDMRPINLGRKPFVPLARPVLTQLSTPPSPTQLVDGPEVAAPFHPGMPLDMDAFEGGAGFSQLFEEEETVRLALTRPRYT
jgi:hypothetical protein